MWLKRIYIAPLTLGVGDVKEIGSFEVNSRYRAGGCWTKSEGKQNRLLTFLLQNVRGVKAGTLTVKPAPMQLDSTEGQHLPAK